MKIRGMIMLMLLAIYVTLTGCSSSPTAVHTSPTSPVLPTMTPTSTLPAGVPPLQNTDAYEPIETLISEIDGMEMVLIPAGNFTMGLSEEDLEYSLDLCSPNCSADDLTASQPQHEVYLDTYWIDRTEVTNEMYSAFLNSEGNQCGGGWDCINESRSKMEFADEVWHSESGYADHPVVGVSWYGAQAYCTWAGRRLPTEAEWEKAARGDDGRLFPWGDRLDRNVANLNDIYICDTSSCDGYKGTSPVGSFPLGASPYGVLDMAGNVEEWVADWFNRDYYAASPAVNPLGPTPILNEPHVVRGGSFLSDPGWAFTVTRNELRPVHYSGFRCASSEYSVKRNFELTSIHMLSEMDGWGLFNASVWITRDGGRTWRDVTPPENPPEEMRAGANGTFLDERDAWIVYAGISHTLDDTRIHGSVWHTADGGQTWKNSPQLPHNFFSSSASVGAMDSQTGLLRIWGLSSDINTTDAFFRTTDGGAIWISFEPCWGLGETGKCYQAIPLYLSGDPEAMQFLPDGTGWLLNLGTCSACPWNHPSYHITKDGGLRWENHKFPPPVEVPDLFDRYAACPPYHLNLLPEGIVRVTLTCGRYYGRDDQPEPIDYLYASDDGGLTWTTYELPPSLATMAGKAWNWSDNPMIFLDADHGLLLGREMFRTADGGATWEHLNTVSWDGQFSFIDRWRGWVVATGEGGVKDLLYTTDGGETWKMLNPVEVE